MSEGAELVAYYFPIGRPRLDARRPLLHRLMAASESRRMCDDYLPMFTSRLSMLGRLRSRRRILPGNTARVAR
jgi:hypothetical protein